jgi:hypothetical protein
VQNTPQSSEEVEDRMTKVEHLCLVSLWIQSDFEDKFLGESRLQQFTYKRQATSSKVNWNAQRASRRLHFCKGLALLESPEASLSIDLEVGVFLAGSLPIPKLMTTQREGHFFKPSQLFVPTPP